MYDLIIKNGLVVDGTGSPAYRADVAVKVGKIEKIAPSIEGEAGKVIDAKDRYVTPGFIDGHTHSDRCVIFGTDGHSHIEQGVTTEVGGQCGSLPVPVHSGTFTSSIGIHSDEQVKEVAEKCKDFKSFFAYLESMDLPTNMAFLIGHGAVRGNVMEYSDKEPTPEELEKMKDWVRQGMECGCVGMSTGLIYPPSVYGKEPELIELAKVVSEYGGNYVSHIRGEGVTVRESVQECLRIGKAANCDTQISHLKVSDSRVKGASKDLLKMIDDANASGMKVRADQYPFIASSTSLLSTTPPEFLVDGGEAFIKRLSDPDFRKKVIEVATDGTGENLVRRREFEGCLVCGAPFTPEYVGKNLLEIAKERNQESEPFHTVFDVIVANKGNVTMAYFAQNEEDMLNIMAHPHVMPGSDGWHVWSRSDRERRGGAHPRFTSTFPRHFRLVRENKLMSMEKAIHRATGMAADMYKLDNIGLLKEGFNADICVIDWENLRETADFIHPFRKNLGLDYVIINGQIAAVDGEATGVRAGRVLKKRK